MTYAAPQTTAWRKSKPYVQHDVAAWLEPVETLMYKLAGGDHRDEIGDIVCWHLDGGGKQLRARLALGAARALGGQYAEAVPWAAACELLHNASLVHDDVQDQDLTRRGRPAVWAQYGVAQAINAGDLMLMLPYQALDHLDRPGGVKWELASTLAFYAAEVVRGQAAELHMASACAIDAACWTRAARGKTSALFALPVHGAALLMGCEAEHAQWLAHPFRQLGLLFQLQDDVLDAYGDKGRPPGSDLHEGRVSALVVEHCALHPHDRQALANLLQRGRDETSEVEVQQWLARFAEKGALHAVWERIHQLQRRINNATELRAVPALARVAQELTKRALAPIEPTRALLQDSKSGVAL
ncbi:MAG: geranylgeranyl diphosphate synthase type I [Kiritimatiellia bacterium]|jgi:geranylgeranyl diphosphate synthase type I